LCLSGSLPLLYLISYTMCISEANKYSQSISLDGYMTCDCSRGYHQHLRLKVVRLGINMLFLLVICLTIELFMAIMLIKDTTLVVENSL